MEMAGLPINEGIEVVDNEVEVIQPLSDVHSSEDLEARLVKEKQFYQDY